VAELVDALVSGTSGESREGSSPFLGTTPPKKFKDFVTQRTAMFVLAALADGAPVAALAVEAPQLRSSAKRL
jgi:hypothetical protein